MTIVFSLLIVWLCLALTAFSNSLYAFNAQHKSLLHNRILYYPFDLDRAQQVKTAIEAVQPLEEPLFRLHHALARFIRVLEG